MRRLLILFLLILPIILLSCSDSLQTYSDKDPKIDLKGYKSYAWVAPGDPRLNPERKEKALWKTYRPVSRYGTAEERNVGGCEHS